MMSVGLLTRRDITFVRCLALTNTVLFAALAAGQRAVRRGIPAYDHGESAPIVLARSGATFVATMVCGLLAIAVWVVARPLSVNHPCWYGVVCMGGAAMAAVPRASILLSVDVTPVAGPSVVILWVLGVMGYGAAIGAAILISTLLIRYHEMDEQRRAEEARATQAVTDLEAEELRVRQMVADQLHGAIQNRLVVIAAGLENLAHDLSASDRGDVALQLRRWAADLDELREEKVRRLSHSLFPSGAQIGTYEAIQLVLDRLPPTIERHFDVGPGLRELADEDLTPVAVPVRLAVVYLVEEAVTNALKHGHAGAVWTQADAIPTDEPGRWLLEVTVDDNGTGLVDRDPALHGLRRHRARVLAHGGTLELTQGPRGGARIGLSLPFTRSQRLPADPVGARRDPTDLAGFAVES